MTDFKDKKAYTTYILIGMNLSVFALEIVSGGSQNLETLYQLGALSPEEVWLGEWWRVLSANFLHFGWLHLITNMLGLYFLGQFVELAIGISRYLFIYLISGTGSMLAFSVLAIKFGDSQQLLVGASAAIMGLVGVIGAMFFRDWRKEKSRTATKRLRFILLVIVLQFVFDLTTPKVSFLSHILGLVIGLIAGYLLLS
jgi:rhomboid protease GluP